MDTNIKEIGHVSFRIKNKEAMKEFYHHTLGLNLGFLLKNQYDEERILYYQLHKGLYIECFPVTKTSGYPEYDGLGHCKDHSYQYTTLGIGEGEKVVDPEGNVWMVNKGELYISKVTYYVNDIKRSVAFYRDIVEADIEEETVDHAIVRMNDYQTIELIFHPYPKNNYTTNKGHCHYALIVHDIEKFARKLESKDVQIWCAHKEKNNPYTTPYQKVKHTENSYNFFITDPDDNNIEVMGYSPESLQLKYALD